MLENYSDPRKRKITENNNAYHINITIDEKNKKNAIQKLKNIVKEIENGTTDCSLHDDTYMPYYWWTCYDYYHST